MLDSPLLNIAYWHDLLKSTSLSKISLNKNQHQAKPASVPHVKSMAQNYRKTSIQASCKTSKGFGDFKHPLKRVWGF